MFGWPDVKVTSTGLANDWLPAGDAVGGEGGIGVGMLIVYVSVNMLL